MNATIRNLGDSSCSLNSLSCAIAGRMCILAVSAGLLPGHEYPRKGTQLFRNFSFRTHPC
jgi:hypothetical protein